MSFEGWMSLGGVELVNSARTAAYAARAGIAVQCRGCAELGASLGDPPYTNPQADEAPWFDPSLPVSKDFFGLLGLGIEGAAAAGVERQWTELLGDGGVGGVLRLASRELEVTALMLGASREALSYGIGWLAAALRGSVCRGGCTGDVLCLYAACPSRPMIGGDEMCSVAGTVPDPEWDPVAAGDRLLRQLFDVSLIEGPTVTERRRVSGGWAYQVQFTVKAGKPHFYTSPIRVATGDGTNGPGGNGYWDRIPDYDPLNPHNVPPPDLPCPAPVDCLDTPEACPDGELPWGGEPFPGSEDDTSGFITDSCYPSHKFYANRFVFSLPRGLQPDWWEQVPIIRFRSGTLPLKSMFVRWYTNPQQLPPGPDLDPCFACHEIAIAWMPPHTELVVDSRTRTATVDCRQQGETPSSVNLYGPRGGPYTWPAFECSTALFVEVIVDATSMSREYQVSIDLASRMDAA